MRNKRIVIVGFILSLQLFCAAAFAQGTGVRGDDVITLRSSASSDVSLNDVFLLKGAGQPTMRLTDQMVRNIKILKSIVERYTGLSYPNYWENVYGRLADYRLTDQLLCPPDAVLPGLESKGRVKKIEAACTLNGITYILRSPFEKLSLIEKYALILHERAHAFDESVHSHDWINPWTQGLYVLLDLKIQQDQGLFRPLQTYEYRALRKLLTLGPHFPREGLDAFASDTVSANGAVQIVLNGGGLIVAENAETLKRVKTDARSFISVDSQISFPLSHCATDVDGVVDTRFLNSTLVHGAFVECANLKNTTVSKSWLRFRSQRISLYGWFDHLFGMSDEHSGLAEVENSEFTDGSKIEFQAFVSIARVKVRHSFLICDDLDSLVAIDLQAPIVNKQSDFTGFSTFKVNSPHDTSEEGVLEITSLSDRCFTGPISNERKAQFK